MPVSNGTVTAPVSVADVQSAIGASANEVGTLCASPYVNKHSKYKPVRHTTLSPITKNQMIAANWGYHMPAPARLDALVQAVIREDHNQTQTLQDWVPATSDEPYDYICYGWWYEKPKGGVASPYRLADFKGYKHATEYFLGCDVSVGDEISGEFWVELKGEIDVDNTDDVGNQSFSRLSNKVLLVGVLKESDTDYTNFKFKSGPAQVVSYYPPSYGVVHITDEEAVKMFGPASGNFYLYFCLIDKDQMLNNLDENGYYKPIQNFDSTQTGTGSSDTTSYAALSAKEKSIVLPCKRKLIKWSHTVTVTNPYAGLTFELSGSIAVNAAGRVTVTATALKITNPTSSAVNVGAASLYVQLSAYGSDGYLKTSDYTAMTNTSGSVSVAAKGTAYLFQSSRVIATDVITFLPYKDGDETITYSNFAASLHVQVSYQESGVTKYRYFPLNAFIAQ